MGYEKSKGWFLGVFSSAYSDDDDDTINSEIFGSNLRDHMKVKLVNKWKKEYSDVMCNVRTETLGS